MRIFLPTGLFVLICAIYTGYWLWASDRMENFVTEWAETQRAAGNSVSWASLKVRGYPFRLEAHIADPSIKSRDWSWQGEKFVLHMMPYSFTHYIGTFVGTQKVLLGGPDARKPLVFEGEAARARASLVLESSDAMRLSVDLVGPAVNRIDQARDMVISRFGAERVQLHLRHWREVTGEDGADARLAVAVQAENADIPTHGLKGLGAVIGLARWQLLLDELPAETGPNLHSLSAYLRAWERQGGEAQLKDFELRWDDIDLSASGHMGLDGTGRPVGEIDTRIGGHAALLEVMRSNRIMKDDQAELVKQALGALNLVSRDSSGRLRLPVKMKKGSLYLGPVMLSRVEPVY